LGTAQRIRQLAEAQLRQSSYSALRNVSCDYRDGVLTLRGELPKYFLKQVAQTLIVANVPEVERVDNQVNVIALDPTRAVGSAQRLD